MTWEKVRRRVRFVRAGTAALAATYRREPDARALIGRFWFTGTRHGLVGLKTWLLETVPPSGPAHSDAVAAAYDVCGPQA